MMSFSEYVEMRTANEGLWLNDKLAVPGISKIMPPKPPKKTKPSPTPKIKPPHVPKSEGSLDQLQRNVDELGKLGIGLLPPKKEDLKRLIDKQKNQVTVPQSRPGNIEDVTTGFRYDRPDGRSCGQPTRTRKPP